MKKRILAYTEGEMRHAITTAIKTERANNAAIADVVQDRANKDGMIAYAACAREIAEGIRSKG